MSDWLKDRLSEKSTWVSVVAGAGMLLKSFVPEADMIANTILGMAGVYEFGRRE